MAFFEAPGVPKVTSPKGSEAWKSEVLAYNNWLDSCYVSTDEPLPCSDWSFNA